MKFRTFSNFPSHGKRNCILGFFLLFRSIMVIFSHLRCGARTLSSCGTRVYLQRAQQQQLRRIGRGEWKTHSIKPRRRRHWFFYIYNTDNPPWVQVFCSHPSSSPEQLSSFPSFFFSRAIICENYQQWRTKRVCCGKRESTVNFSAQINNKKSQIESSDCKCENSNLCASEISGSDIPI